MSSKRRRRIRVTAGGMLKERGSSVKTTRIPKRMRRIPP
jgi:hypothetical protein